MRGRAASTGRLAGCSPSSYQDEHYDEREPIADTAAQTGARTVSIDAAHLDMVKLLPEVVRANGEPVHSLSAVANYCAGRLARTTA